MLINLLDKFRVTLKESCINYSPQSIFFTISIVFTVVDEYHFIYFTNSQVFLSWNV